MEARRHTLLIVDDEPDVLDSLRHLFHRRYRVLAAGSAVDALRLLESERDQVHVLLSDQRMPGMTGDEFLARAREIVPDAIRLLFTGYADIQAVINAVNKGGIFRYILKPWDAADMEAVVRQAVEQYELLAERKRLIAELQAANSQLVAANRDLAEADQLKTAFLEVASHELNTPITIVQGLSELLQLTNPDRPEMERDILRQIAEGSRQLSRLVGGMLKLVASGEFGDQLHTEPVELGPFIREAVARVEPFIQARRLRCRLELAEDLGQFEIDTDRIRDVLLNLLTNAIKFTPDEGEFSVTARLVGPDEAEVQIADRGIGLEPRALQRLFSPFFTEFDPKHHSSGDFGFGKRGMGLGLYLVKTFIEQHGGSVSARSAPGEGTEVRFRLPRRPCPGADRAVEYSGPAETGDPAGSTG